MIFSGRPAILTRSQSLRKLSLAQIRPVAHSESARKDGDAGQAVVAEAVIFKEEVLLRNR